MLIAVLALAASSWIRIPMYPVPMTMQTYAVLAVGGLLGLRLGTLSVALWLLLAALGLPLLAGGAGGTAPFAGSTAGYIWAFPVAAALTGLAMATAPRTRSDMRALCLVMLAGHAVCLVGGAAWLSTVAGYQTALHRGLLPFIPGAIVKSILAAGTVYLWRGRRPGR